jgi:ABC-type cobalamin transport system permease subunit
MSSWQSSHDYSFIRTRQTGLSPLAPGQWKPFLAINAGFMVFQNVLRPVQIALAVLVSPYFDRVVEGFERRFNLSHRASITVTAILANVVGTLALMAGGIGLAATLAGVPVFA